MGPGSPFNGLLGLATQKLRILYENGLLAGHGANNRRDAGIITIPDPDSLAFIEIDAAEILDKCGDEMLPSLLAVADNVDPRLSLIVQNNA